MHAQKLASGPYRRSYRGRAVDHTVDDTVDYTDDHLKATVGHTVDHTVDHTMDQTVYIGRYSGPYNGRCSGPYSGRYRWIFYFGTFLTQKLADVFPREQITLPPGQVGGYCCSRKIRFSNVVLNRKCTSEKDISHAKAQGPRDMLQDILHTKTQDTRARTGDKSHAKTQERHKTQQI